MNELAIVVKNILLIGDDPQSNAELTACLERSFSKQARPAISQYQLDTAIQTTCREELHFDVILVNVTDQSKVTSAFVDKWKRSVSPGVLKLLVLASELAAKPVRSLAAQCHEVFLHKELSPNLLGCAIRHIVVNRKLRNEMSEREIRYNAVLDGIAEGIVVCDADGNIESMNPMAEQIFGCVECEVIAKNLLDFISDVDQKTVDEFIQVSKSAELQQTLRFESEVQGRRVDDSHFPMELLIRSTRMPSRGMLTCIVRDTTLTKQKEEELQLTATAFETHTAILITGVDGTILRVNPAFTQITGYTAEEAIGNNPKMLQSGHHDEAFYVKFWESVKTTGRWEGEIWNKRKNGEIYPEWQTITAVKNNSGETTHYVATFQDITERKQTQALIEHHAFYDALTNLPNRRMMLDRLNQELSASRRHQVYGALLFLDLDHFKTLNDSMGHAVGDSLLQQMAKRLSNNVRAEDTVSRLGGDEFVVLLSNLGSKERSATAMANSIAKKIHAAISRPYQLEGHAFSFTSSIGITLFPFASDSADDVLKHADAAMYRAKGKGRNAICFYQSNMQVEADQRLQLEKELRAAINNDELVLYYQPQFNNQNALVGAEALLRWAHPKRGIVEPKDFIALAEETNLIQQMGVWVMKTAVEQYVEWRDSGLFVGREYIAINVSPRQFQQDDFVSEVADVLKSHDISPSSLKLELTESMLLGDLHDVVEKMNQLKELGVSFSMDDFGTGFSSLAYLKRLPFDQIKIDKAFIRDVARDINDAAIVETIIAMAEHLRLDVIAEGVETREEFEFLQRKGCVNYQGFYFSTPLQASSFEQTIRELQNSNRSAAITRF